MFQGWQFARGWAPGCSMGSKSWYRGGLPVFWQLCQLHVYSVYIYIYTWYTDMIYMYIYTIILYCLYIFIYLFICYYTYIYTCTIMQTCANNVSIWLAELSTLGTTPYKIVTVAMPIAKRRSDVLPRCQLCFNQSTMTILDKITFAVKNECGNIMVHVILHISYISMCVCVLMIAMTMSQNHLAKTIGSMLNMINVACPCVSVSYSTPYKYLVFVLMTPHVALGSVAHFDWWKYATPIASCSNSE